MRQKRQHIQATGGVTPEPWLTTAEVCAVYQLNAQFIYRRHDVPRIYVGGQMRFQRSALDAYFAKQSLK
ncbi:MAG: helix-turn-helix domain-containing protein [Nitrospira sp.]|nr:helix-turn-helix domain-containing protein [Nitrospira sp.]